MKKSLSGLAGSGCSYCCCSPAGVLALYTPNRRATRPSSRRWDNCATPRSTTKTRSSSSWPRAVIRASGPSSRRSWKIASTSATRIRRFSSSSRGEEDSTTLDLIDPLTLKAAGSASVDDLTKIGTNNHLRRVLQTTLARFGLSSPDASVRLDAVREIEQDLDEGNVQLLRERSGRGNEFQGQKGNCHGSGARRAGRFGCAGASRRDLHAPPQPPPGCAEQAGGFAREISRRQLRRKR